MAAAEAGLYPMNENFYRAFEEKHRGTRQTIISRLRAYLPFVEPLSNIFRGAPTIDLGCGRGEWLELMVEIGFNPYGVDLDEGMLQACEDAGLPAEKGDAVAYIGHLPDESQVVVSIFHVIEHLTIEQVHIVILEALRVLKPGGLLIMETPNPENIIVSTQNFYLDPTHQRPIPSQLLSFLPEYHGFSRVKTIRLQENKELSTKSSLTLRDVLGGVSPDYAVIAQKGALEDVFHLLDDSFDLEYGLSLNTLATHYDNQMKNQAQQSETTANQAITMAQQAETKAQQAETKAQQAETKAQQAETKAQQAETKAQQAETKAQQAETKAQQAEQALTLVYTSRSWRITAPLRWLNLQLELLNQYGLRTRADALLRKSSSALTQCTFQYITVRPRLHSMCVSSARKLRLYEPLQNIYKKLLNPQHSSTIWKLNGCEIFNDPIAHLTPRARRIYSELKAAIEKHNGTY
jgi:SAM-dependent methyltransferase